MEFLTNKESLAETSTVKKNIEEKEITSNQEANTGDEFADLIINELGGEEISWFCIVFSFFYTPSFFEKKGILAIFIIYASKVNCGYWWPCRFR